MLAAYDELWSGVAVIAAPGVERSSGVGHAGYTLWIFAIPMLLSTLIEAPIAFWSDRVSMRRVLGGGLIALAASLALCALSEQVWLFSVGLALAGAASGVACAAAQAALVSRHNGGAARALSRWIAFGATGDLLAPLVVAAGFAFGGSYRLALAAIAVAVALHGWLLWRARDEALDRRSDGDDEDDAAPSLREAVRRVRSVPQIWPLLFAEALCLLLDELVIALAALHLHDRLAWSDADIALAMSGCAAGELFGAVVMERVLVRVSAPALLALSALGSLAALALFVLTSSSLVAALALVLLGVAATPHYPLVRAAVYELLPGTPGLVNALAEMFVVVEISGPLLIGAVATRFGVDAALACLAVQPLAMLAVAWSQRRATNRPAAGSSPE